MCVWCLNFNIELPQKQKCCILSYLFLHFSKVYFFLSVGMVPLCHGQCRTTASKCDQIVSVASPKGKFQASSRRQLAWSFGRIGPLWTFLQRKKCCKYDAASFIAKIIFFFSSRPMLEQLEDQIEEFFSRERMASMRSHTFVQQTLLCSISAVKAMYGRPPQ